MTSSIPKPKSETALLADDTKVLAKVLGYASTHHKTDPNMAVTVVRGDGSRVTYTYDEIKKLPGHVAAHIRRLPIRKTRRAATSGTQFTRATAFKPEVINFLAEQNLGAGYTGQWISKTNSHGKETFEATVTGRNAPRLQDNLPGLKPGAYKGLFTQPNMNSLLVLYLNYAGHAQTLKPWSGYTRASYSLPVEFRRALGPFIQQAIAKDAQKARELGLPEANIARAVAAAEAALADPNAMVSTQIDPKNFIFNANAVPHANLNKLIVNFVDKTAAIPEGAQQVVEQEKADTAFAKKAFDASKPAKPRSRR